MKCKCGKNLWICLGLSISRLSSLSANSREERIPESRKRLKSKSLLDLGHSFSRYGPPSRPITYMQSIGDILTIQQNNLLRSQFFLQGKPGMDGIPGETGLLGEPVKIYIQVFVLEFKK